MCRFDMCNYSLNCTSLFIFVLMNRFFTTSSVLLSFYCMKYLEKKRKKKFHPVVFILPDVNSVCKWRGEGIKKNNEIYQMKILTILNFKNTSGNKSPNKERLKSRNQNNKAEDISLNNLKNIDST